MLLLLLLPQWGDLLAEAGLRSAHCPSYLAPLRRQQAGSAASELRMLLQRLQSFLRWSLKCWKGVGGAFRCQPCQITDLVIFSGSAAFTAHINSYNHFCEPTPLFSFSVARHTTSLLPNTRCCPSTELRCALPPASTSYHEQPGARTVSNHPLFLLLLPATSSLGARTVSNHHPFPLLFLLLQDG
jgi:hypothetical protein